MTSVLRWNASKADDRSAEFLAWVASGQGFYYLFTGLWPLLDPFTFQLVTGPKVDLWLVKTVGVLVTVIGSVLIMGGLRKTLSVELAVLAIGSAIGLTAIDVVYALSGRIQPIYLADAALEIGVAAAWIVLLVRSNKGEKAASSNVTPSVTLGSTPSARSTYHFVANLPRRRE